MSIGTRDMKMGITKDRTVMTRDCRGGSIREMQDKTADRKDNSQSGHSGGMLRPLRVSCWTCWTLIRGAILPKTREKGARSRKIVREWLRDAGDAWVTGCVWWVGCDRNRAAER